MKNKTNIEDITNVNFLIRDLKAENYNQALINSLENILADREKWKRLAEQNLKNSEEFKNNMCEHRCIKNNEILELQAKANKYDALVEKMKEKLKELKENDSEIYDTDSEDLVIAKYETRAMIDTLQELIPEEE